MLARLSRAFPRDGVVSRIGLFPLFRERCEDVRMEGSRLSRVFHHVRCTLLR
jgi:hypothetical protein